MKRIAILSDRFPPLPCGGIGSAHYNLYRMFKSNGYEVKVFTYLEDPLQLKGLSNEPDILRFGPSQLENRLFKYLNFIRRKIDKWILQNPKEKEGAYQLNLVRLANIGSRKINKQLIHFHPDIVFIPDFGVPGFSLKKIPYTKFIHISHNNPIRFIDNPLIGVHNKKDALAAIKYEQISLQKINLVICPSNYMKEVFSDTFSFDKEIIVIPNLINREFIHNIKRKDLHGLLMIDPCWPIVYIPSAGSKFKGEQYVIEIIRRISNKLNNRVGFYLSGKLSENQSFELRFLPNFNIYSPGDVNLETNISCIKDCYICISPTLFECFGMALLEALFCSLPCVAFNVGGNKELINDNNGYLVPFLDIESLISKSLEIINSEELHNAITENTKESQEKYSSNTGYTHYYSKLINKYSG